MSMSLLLVQVMVGVDGVLGSTQGDIGTPGGLCTVGKTLKSQVMIMKLVISVESLVAWQPERISHGHSQTPTSPSLVQTESLDGQL